MGLTTLLALHKCRDKDEDTVTYSFFFKCTNKLGTKVLLEL